MGRELCRNGCGYGAVYAFVGRFEIVRLADVNLYSDVNKVCVDLLSLTFW